MPTTPHRSSALALAGLAADLEAMIETVSKGENY